MPYKKFNKAIIRYKTVDAACRNYKGGILNKKVQDFYSLHVDSFGHPPENRLL